MTGPWADLSWQAYGFLKCKYPDYSVTLKLTCPTIFAPDMEVKLFWPQGWNMTT